MYKFYSLFFFNLYYIFIYIIILIIMEIKKTQLRRPLLQALPLSSSLRKALQLLRIIKSSLKKFSSI